jgi:hypothetical protein
MEFSVFGKPMTVKGISLVGTVWFQIRQHITLDPSLDINLIMKTVGFTISCKRTVNNIYDTNFLNGRQQNLKQNFMPR